MTKKTIILASGGTGGHVFPAYALGAHFLKEGHHVHLLTDQRGSNFQGKPKKLGISILPLTRRKRGLLPLLILLLSLIPSTFMGLYHLLRLNPQVILGCGGFPSAPTLVAAILLRPFRRHKIVLLEQNAFIGRVNRKLLPFVHVLATSFPKTWGIPKRFQHKVSVAGNLVRDVFTAPSKKAYEAPKKTGTIRLLIIGGSQGARSFSTLVPNALNNLPETLRKRIHVVQQSRPEMIEQTQKLYKKMKIHLTTQPFFDNIHDLMEKAHLIICRSGSSTVFEVAHSKRPAIFVPFPHAMDNHQYFNAQAVVTLEGGWMCQEKEIKHLSPLLKNVLEDPKKLARAAQNVHDLVERDALKCFSHLINSLWD